MKPLKFLIDSQFSWDWILGPVYNRRIWEAAGNFISEIIRQTQPPLNANILDLGCGPGLATRLFAVTYPSTSVTGIDFSVNQIKSARRHLTRNPAENCSFKIGNAMDIPCKDNTFDFVYSIASIKHWPDKLQGLKEIRRVLRPDGSALLVEADRNFNIQELEVFVQALAKPWWVYTSFVRWYARTTVFGQSLSQTDAEQTAYTAGFHRVQIEKLPDQPFFIMKLHF